MAGRLVRDDPVPPSFPVEPRPPAEPRAEAASADGARQLRVLVIEDNPGDARLVQEMLREAAGVRFTVDPTDTLAQGMERLAAGGVDLVLLDLGLPDSQGLETLHRLLHQAPQMPVVVMSGLADVDVALEAVHDGAQDYLVKGRVGPELMERALRYAVERAHLAAELQEAVRGREAFMASAAHDLRNALGAIRLHVDLLGRQFRGLPLPDTETIARRVRHIDVVVGRGTAMIDELVDATRLELAGTLELRRRPVDLVGLVQATVAAYEGTSEEARLTLQAAEEAIVGHWDGQRLARVVDNLISNAVKYSLLDTPILIRITREPGDDEECAVLSVSDQGFGIPAADLPRLFERFHRASNVRGEIRGTGLGLWGARRIVEQHGGTITVASLEGIGSTFTVRLPLA